MDTSALEVDLPRLEIVCLKYLVLDDSNDLAAIVDDRVKHLASVRLNYVADTGLRLLRRKEHRDQFGLLGDIVGRPNSAPLGIEAGRGQGAQ
jgi:hypothetical protein